MLKVNFVLLIFINSVIFKHFIFNFTPFSLFTFYNIGISLARNVSAPVPAGANHLPCLEQRQDS